MTAKKENAKRLGIYLLIVFLFVLLFFICRKPMNESNTAFFIIYYCLFSFSPAIASLITRAVTKEGFCDMKLHLKLERNIKWYLLAFGLPLIFFSARILLPIIVSGHSEWLGGFTFQNVLASVFMLAALSAVQSLGTGVRLCRVYEPQNGAAVRYSRHLSDRRYRVELVASSDGYGRLA